MAIKKIKTDISKAKILSPSQEQAYTMVPDDGAEVYITMFKGSATPQDGATICASWEYDTVNETVVDVVNSGVKKYVGTGDGVKKLALIFSNSNGTEDIAFSADLVVTEEVDV